METSKHPSFRAIVVGGGIAGLATAIGLRRQGHAVVVLESTPTLQTMGGSLLIPPSAARVLDNFGVWKNILAGDNAPVSHTTFRYADGKVLESVSYTAMELRVGYPATALTRENYQRILYSEAIKAGVEVRFSSRIVHLDVAAPSLTLASGEHIHGDLIIGADGIKSTVRAAILGANDVEPISEAVAYQFKLPSRVMESSHVTAPLMKNNQLQSWYGPGCNMIAGSSNSGEHYAVTLTVYPTDNDDISDSLDVLANNSSSSYRRGDIHAMRESVEMFELRVRRLMEMVEPEDCFLWKLAYLPKLDSWVSPSGKVAVLGDAAHAMVPHLGMGAASAVEDAGVLAECIRYARSAEDIPLVLSAYQRIRKPRAENIQVAALTTGIYKSLKDGPEQRERDRKMAERMDVDHPKYEAWKAGGGLDWLYAYNFVDASKKELDKVFGVEEKGSSRARL
ncbi:hypothetical protein F5884DRAFT_862973 [Xylogone sp. PMI_703]|nr:hypothetical protein F5884DRAFT_862973 [Xylogone sp. PMI_703]